ncbi:endonuclease domain-containing protein [Methylogaea oryzae]|uniref:DNA methylase n=1 Tax=Methylogaea oryzae TaxID=1295382 RepID=A0A8D4VNM5_9GAMM|nr:endonuclease domain-containing protein [Methylogaea oryzae]BBL70539.1 DNA methylase [Methylogaea oryzae]
MKELARTLRQQQTDVEELLWYRLRNRRMNGCKFRRQEPIGPYVADFLCMQPKLIIELDGGQHGEQLEKDQHRTQYLETLGYRVLRFWNHEVLTNLEAVLEVIHLATANHPPHPNPLPKGEGTGGACD